MRVALVSAGRLMLVTVLLLALGIPYAGPAAAIEPSWVLISDSATVKRGGTRYAMRLTVMESGGNEMLSVNLSRTLDPAGVTRSQQSTDFQFSLDGSRFRQRSSLASAAVDTATDMGDYGRVDVAFRQRAATRSACEGHVRSRVGRLSGRLRLDTKTDTFGVLTTLPARATLLLNDGRCRPGGGGGGRLPCPTPGLTVGASRWDTDPLVLTATRNKGSKWASVYASTSEALSVEGGRMSSAIAATLPAANVKISGSLSTATVKGRKGTFLRGTATWTGVGQAQNGPPTPCGRGRESRFTTRSGSLRGTLRADFFAGGDRTVGRVALPGTATRVTVGTR